MTVHVHRLGGCTPTPLAHYLKALAVLRLVSEQADAGARGWWKRESFWLATALSREELVAFFLERYAPTPMLSPWNGGSGFFYEDDAGLTPLESSTAPRFQALRAGIADARRLCAPLAAAISAHKAAEEAAKGARNDPALKETLALAKATRDAEKAALLPACRRAWMGGLLEWLDAALAIGADGDAAWPALLRTGGNDGRLDFTNNALQHLSRLFATADPLGAPTSLARALLPSSLFGAPAPGLCDAAAGQFFSGNAGGDNMSTGFGGKSQVNPWDFVLMLEGSVVMASSVARRAEADELPQAAAPFAVRSAGAGFPSASVGDDVPRGEQWLPLWRQPAHHAEVRRLFAEGRVRLGRETATRAGDVPRALARLGNARGLSEFQRFAYMERNGQANLAVPVGRWSAHSAPAEDVLEDVAAWSNRLRVAARDPRAPRALTSAARELDEAMLSTCRVARDAPTWQQLLRALAHAEHAVQTSRHIAGDPRKGLSPLPLLRPSWLERANDDSPEFRLALALASQSATFCGEGGEVQASIRGHWMPIDRSRAPRAAARFALGASGILEDPDVVCVGRDLERDCLSLLARRAKLAPKLKSRTLGLSGHPQCGAAIADVMAFVNGQVDDEKIASLARALMAVRWWEPVPDVGAPPACSPDAAYALLRTAYAPAPIVRGRESTTIQLDPEPLARMTASDASGAVAVCLRRLTSSGLVPTLRTAVLRPGQARRVAASLVFPLCAADLRRCVDLVTKPQLVESYH